MMNMLDLLDPDEEAPPPQDMTDLLPPPGDEPPPEPLQDEIQGGPHGGGAGGEIPLLPEQESAPPPPSGPDPEVGTGTSGDEGVVGMPPPLPLGLDTFSAPIPSIPLSLPPSIPPTLGGTIPSAAGRRSLLGANPQRRRIIGGPGSPIIGSPVGIDEDERMKMIMSGLGF